MVTKFGLRGAWGIIGHIYRRGSRGDFACLSKQYFIDTIGRLPKTTQVPIASSAHRSSYSAPSLRITQLPAIVPDRLPTPRSVDRSCTPGGHSIYLRKHVSVTMRALWSRATGSPITCRCVQCAPRTPAIARRSGAVSIKGPWAFGTPTSTFLYTAIFAAGFAIDGSAKHRRNQQWERAFSSLRESSDVEADDELARPMAEETVQLEDHGDAHVVTGANITYIMWDEPKILDDQDVLAGSQSLCFVPGNTPIHELFPDRVDWDDLFQVAGEEITHGMRQLESESNYVTGAHDDLLSIDCTFPYARLPPWPANTGQDLLRHNLPPQSLWAADSIRKKALRRRQTWKKLLIQELSVGMFIYSLLGPARRLSLPEDYRSQLAPSVRDVLGFGDLEVFRMRGEMRAAIDGIECAPAGLDEDDVDAFKFLLDSRLPYARPQYFQDSDGEFFRIRDHLNSAIKEILTGEAPQDKTQVAMALGKIAHNLLVSSAPPDVQTFNILISGLRRWSLHGLVDQLILALDKCKIRPNEITCAEILEHYIGSNRPHDFGDFVQKMRGIRNALMLARPDIMINEVAQDRLIRVTGALRNKIYQKVSPTPLVFNSIIRGVLQFAGIERALEIYYEMKTEGWGLDAPGLTRLLADCIPRSDWNSGQYIWEEIESIKAATKPSSMAEAYSHMLSLCTVTGNTAAFNHILRGVTIWSRGLLEQGFKEPGITTKEIVDAAIELTRSVQKETSPTAPAWSADNLLIAMSGPVEEEEPPSATEPAELLQPLDAGMADTPSLTEHLPPETTDPWSIWLESELGGRTFSLGAQSQEASSPVSEGSQSTEEIESSAESQVAHSGVSEESQSSEDMVSIIRKVLPRNVKRESSTESQVAHSGVSEKSQSSEEMLSNIRRVLSRNVKRESISEKSQSSEEMVSIIRRVLSRNLKRESSTESQVAHSGVSEKSQSSEETLSNIRRILSRNVKKNTIPDETIASKSQRPAQRPVLAQRPIVAQRPVLIHQGDPWAAALWLTHEMGDRANERPWKRRPLVKRGKKKKQTFSVGFLRKYENSM
ncbi:uncharacterized protein EI97DRAFT_442654 [Westerdykella ornata]|uniref:Pentatricopeptide repeat protein n=1 Tax=Westerdykella ornata TaxID=318751 RepID=A0A6A6JJK3_WESOR|nr:uncharacterized protein EI97DRAFT_442654 [Westerdykella ornata]KAF2276168.1 hypothetical protein EI97DRAFT_442654 [Westerdykella ornata]